MLRRYVTAIVGRPKLVIALVALVTLTLGFFMTRLHVLLDVDAQIPPGHPLVITGKRIEKLFGGKYMTVIGFYPESGTVYTPDILGKVKRVTDKLEKLPGVKTGQRPVAHVVAGEGHPQLGRLAGDHAARRQGARRPTPRSRRFARASRPTAS